MIIDKNFTFIDLFAGIGGFHCAMNKYSNNQARCVFASEIDEKARNIYSKYYNMEVFGDITKATQDLIKEQVDVVCGGFPCQTFSKAGAQKGFGDPRGTLFKEIIRLIEKENLEEQPKILILENVRNLITHDKGVTWRTIKKELKRVNYNVIDVPLVVSPKDFGIPQLRERAIILAVRKDIFDKKIELTIEKKPNNSTCIYSFIDNRISKKEKEKYALQKRELDVLNAWNAFIKGINKKIIGFPIWSDEFGKNYDITDLPEWKQEFIKKNRKLYKENKDFIDAWLKEYNIRQYIPTYRKFEWQVNGKIDDVFEGIIQFRPSGVRVKQPTESPALVAMVHKPILGKYKRYLTPKEAAKLQSFPNDFPFKMENDHEAYKQLGNAVNVEVIYKIFQLFIEFLEESKED